MLLVQARGRALWSRLPERIRASPVAGLLRTRWAVAEEPSQEPGEPQEPDVVDDGPATRVVRTLADLDVELQELDRLATISDDALRAGFSQFEMELELSLPADPRSAAYRERWLELYRWLHGKPYTPANEVNAFDVQSHVDRPFPYSTQSPSTVGQHLIAVGHVIRTMDLAPGSQVLEMGPGWVVPRWRWRRWVIT